MTDRFLKFFAKLIGNEGSYSDNKNDKGGKTIYGISHKSFPSQFDICYALWKDSPTKALAYAQGFYFATFYKPIYENIHDEKLAFKLFDLGVNMYIVTAIRILQDSLGIPSDGIFGKCTLAAINSKDCYQDYLHEAEKHYRQIVADDPTQAEFLKGWLARLYKGYVV